MCGRKEKERRVRFMYRLKSCTRVSEVLRVNRCVGVARVADPILVYVTAIRASECD